MSELNSIYDQAFKEYKDSAKSYCWGSDKIRDLYYQLVLMSTSWKGQSCLDIGCGSGGLLEYIQKNNKNIVYSGIDINQKFIDLAKQKFPKHAFFCDHFLDFECSEKIKPDYCLIPGTFNLLPNTVKEPHEYIHKVLSKSLEISKKGVSIIFKTKLNQKENTDLVDCYFYAYNPIKLLEMSLELTPYVKLDHSYSKNIASLFLYH